MSEQEAIQTVPILQAGVFPAAGRSEVMVRLDTSTYPDVHEVIRRASTGPGADAQVTWRFVVTGDRQGIHLGLRFTRPMACAFQVVFERDVHLPVLRAAAAAGRLSLTNDDLDVQGGRWVNRYSLVIDEPPALVAALAGSGES